MQRMRRQEAGFTLIELGIVIAVIAILATVVLVGRGFLVSSRVAKAVETIDVTQKAVSTYSGTNRGTIPAAPLLVALQNRELLSANFAVADAIVPEFTFNVIRLTPETYQVSVACAQAGAAGIAACEDICNSKSTDDSLILSGGCGAGGAITLDFRL